MAGEQLNQWPDWVWWADQDDDERVAAVPFVLTELYVQKKMKEEDVQAYIAQMAELSQRLPQDVDRLVARLDHCIDWGMAAHLDRALWLPSDPASLYSAVTVGQVDVLQFACDCSCLRGQLCRRISHFNHQIDRDVRAYLTLALTKPRSPNLGTLSKVIFNHCRILRRFARRTQDYIEAEKDRLKRGDEIEEEQHLRPIEVV